MTKTIITVALLLSYTALNTIRLPATDITPKHSYVTATVYHAVPEQTNGDPAYTASMFKIDLNNPHRHRIVAVSRDLLVQYPFKTKVLISGAGKYDGVYTVRDVTSKRLTNRIDILINQGMSVGKWKNVRITKV